MSEHIQLPEWPRLMPAPPAGVFKQQPEHFVVVEELGFTPEGQGKHLWCWVEKRGVDTLHAIKQCARVLGLRERDIGYSGIKDRQAVTRQWLSFPTELPPDSAQLNALEQLGVTLLECIPHPRKLKRGSHRRNRFELVVGFAEQDRSNVSERWQRLVQQGVPNYFGSQRFGFQGANIERARRLLARGWRKREDRQGLLLSSARSYLFNMTLAARIEAGNWDQALAGDVMNLDGTNSLFSAANEQPERISERLTTLDIHPTAPLWGKGEPGTQADALALEQTCVAHEQELVSGLQQAGVELSRRATRLRLASPEWQVQEHGARLVFSLARGAYATSVLRELMSAPGL